MRTSRRLSKQACGLTSLIASGSLAVGAGCVSDRSDATASTEVSARLPTPSRSARIGTLELQALGRSLTWNRPEVPQAVLMGGSQTKELTSEAGLFVRAITPDLAFVQGSADQLTAVARRHPTLAIEVSPPLRPKLDVAIPVVRARVRPNGATTIDGRGSYVGIVDTGLDIFHPDFRTADGKTRVAWYLDFSRSARTGNDLDQAYGGRVWSRQDIDTLLASVDAGGVAPSDAPSDDSEGHGTHVAGIAAATGANSAYAGVAPGADLVIVRATDQTGSLSEARVALGAQFVFDMAARDGRPAVVNLSLGSQYGSHDGTSLFEQSLVQLVGGPGRAIVVAASNEGALGIHTNQHLAAGTTTTIPIELPGRDGAGADYRSAEVYGWLGLRSGASLSVSLRGPDGAVWVPPQGPGSAAAMQPRSQTVAQVVNATTLSSDDQDPTYARAVRIFMRGPLPAGRYELVLEGDGFVEVWLQGSGDAESEAAQPYFPRGALVAGTIGVPGSAAGLISVGCETTRSSYVDAIGRTQPVTDYTRVITGPGSWCSFSSAGPSADGAFRPDLLAPGLGIISALATTAYTSWRDPEVVDTRHRALSGTSMSSPFVAGAAALLFQKDPTLDQESLRAVLQASARPVVEDEASGLPGPYDPVVGAGGLDVQAAVTTLERRGGGPSATSGRLRLSSRYLAADGLVPLHALVQTRDASGAPADAVGGVSAQLAAGHALVSPVEHPAPGLYRFSLRSVGSLVPLRLRVTTPDGAIALEDTVPVAVDTWDAAPGRSAVGGCTWAAKSEPPSLGWPLVGWLGLTMTVLATRRFRWLVGQGSAKNAAS